MGTELHRLGDYIRPVDVRNRDLKVTNPMGINIEKYFMPSVANVIGTDLSAYKMVFKNQFACNLMHVGRDEKIPIAMHTDENPIIVSPAYFVFEIISVETHGPNVETHGRASLPINQPICQRQPKSISSFVAGFKSSTIKQIDDWIDSNNVTMAKFNKNNPLWQSNYHDHIIRNENEYRRISDYIIRNPIEWNEDTLNNNC